MTKQTNNPKKRNNTVVPGSKANAKRHQAGHQTGFPGVMIKPGIYTKPHYRVGSAPVQKTFEFTQQSYNIQPLTDAGCSDAREQAREAQRDAREEASQNAQDILTNNQKNIDNLTTSLKNVSYISNLPDYLRNIFDDISTKFATFGCLRNNLKSNLKDLENSMTGTEIPDSIKHQAKAIQFLPPAMHSNYIEALLTTKKDSIKEKIKELDAKLVPESINLELKERLKPFFDNKSLEDGNHWPILLESAIKSKANSFISKQEKDRMIRTKKRETLEKLKEQKLEKLKDKAPIDTELELKKLRIEMNKLKLKLGKNLKGAASKGSVATPKTQKGKNSKKQKKNGNTKPTSGKRK